MIQIDSTSSILIDGKQTGLAVVQHLVGSTIYRPETASLTYAEIKMPKSRYTLSTDAGRAEFEEDIKSVL